MKHKSSRHSSRHSGESRNPVLYLFLKRKFTTWIPAFAGMTVILGMTVVFFLFSGSINADDEPKRVAWVMDDSYKGSHDDLFQKLRYEVPILMRQTLIDLAVRLGLDFQDGWQYPMFVRFVDQAPYGVENALAYVQLGKTEAGFIQLLNINLEAYAQAPFNFKKVLAHELVHAMLNDALGGDAAMTIPVWLHEGMAVYGAGQGDQMVLTYTHQFSGFAESTLVNGLEGPHGALDYAEDYLAIKYIYAKHGVNALHNFSQKLIENKGDYKTAIKYTCGENWNDFLANARKYSEEEIGSLGVGQRDEDQNPY